MGDITKEEMRERLGNIDQIRDIIFGSQLREYDNRFSQIESDIALLRQEMRDRVDELKNVLTSELRAATDSLEKKFKSLNLATQEESTELRQQIDRINRKFGNSIDALNDAVDTQKSTIREEVAQTREKLQEDVRALRSHVFEELDGRFSMLREVKISRDDMAEMLFELGMRLKGTEFVPELKEAANTNVLSELLLPEQSDSVDPLKRPQRPEI